MTRIINNNDIKNLSIGGLLGADGGSFIVPMYQRNYAWDQAEIDQLIEDVADYQKASKDQEASKDQPYYIGTLVVHRRPDGKLEVIDGQQRLTTLVLIALYLKHRKSIRSIADFNPVENKLAFESRPEAQRSLNLLRQGGATMAEQSGDPVNGDLIHGYKLIESALNKKKDLKAFRDYLANNVKIAIVHVPQDTDLNHYFEIMNNRGEQLEKHEIIKARFLSLLSDDDRAVFARVWDAVSNMERYVQYGFSPAERAKIFGDGWGGFQVGCYDCLKEVLETVAKDQEKKPDESAKAVTSEDRQSLHDILTGPAIKDETDKGDNERPDRFNSIVNFPNFLLHVLRVMKEADIALDDKQLFQQFDRYIPRNTDALCKKEQIKFAKEFIFALLKVKYLLDQYVIKREFSEKKEEWSLKRLKKYDSKSTSYVGTFERDGDSKSAHINKKILMLLAAMHVSTPTQNYKHWLNGVLYRLYDMGDITAVDYLKRLENLARLFMFGRYLADKPAEYHTLIYDPDSLPTAPTDRAAISAKLRYGEIENNFVFNYLDYLLWWDWGEKDKNDEIFKKFTFTFRSSVEHFYPQNPEGEETKLNDTSLHSFGNLCLISHSKNSRLGNLPPGAKYAYFEAGMNSGKIESLKLYKMLQELENGKTWSVAAIHKLNFEFVDRLLGKYNPDSKSQVQEQAP